MIRRTWEALLGAAVILGGIASLAPVQAADLGRGSIKDAAPRHVEERPAIANWSGLYFGVNVGYAWKTVNEDYAPYSAPPALSPKVSEDGNGGILGGHLGIQHQLGRFVVGVEGSWSGNAPFGNDWHSASCFATAVDPNYSCQSRMNSIFTVGPRLGITHDRYMFYVTGGYASAQINTREFGDCSPGGCGPAIRTNHFDWSHRHNGWFVGGGVEALLHERWVVGLEYLHVDLDTSRHYPSYFPGESRNVDGEADILRLRLSYKLGREAHVPAQPMK